MTKLFKHYLTSHFTVFSHNIYLLIIPLWVSSTTEMSRHTYCSSPYVLWLFSKTVLDVIPLKQGLKMPASPDLLALISQQNSRSACKPLSGSHCSSEYLFLILVFTPHHSMSSQYADRPQRGFTHMLSLCQQSLETIYLSPQHSTD